MKSLISLENSNFHDVLGSNWDKKSRHESSNVKPANKIADTVIYNKE